MPYRAPELFDVKTDATLDEKVDIWVRRPSASPLRLTRAVARRDAVHARVPVLAV